MKLAVRRFSALVLTIVVMGASAHAADDSLVWSPYFTGNGQIESSPAIAPDGTIYIANELGYLFAVNPDGSTKWPFHGAGGAINSTPAVGADGTIYFGCYDGNLYAVAGSNGREKWAFQTGNYIYSSPAIGADGTIYVGSGDGSLYAIAPDKTELWHFATGGNIDSSPAIGPDGTIYIGSYDQSLYAINPDGSQKWSFPTGDRIVAPPAIGADGTIYVGSKDGNLYALTPGGNSKWTMTTGGAVETSPAIGPNGDIYFASTDGNLYAAAPDGTLLWHVSPAGSSVAIYSSPAVRADGTIIVGAGNNLVVALNPDGSTKWSYPTGDTVDSSPVVAANGTIYVGSWDGCLYAFAGDGSGPANSAWPLFHHDLARAGRATSSNAAATDPGRLINLSVLDPLSSINPTLILGFVSGGDNVTGTQNVLIRGIGPALAPYLPGPLVLNPTLTVFQGGGAVAANVGWASTPANQQAVTAADALVGAFALPNPASADSALVMSVTPSSDYSAVITGTNAGYALAEVYDATPAGSWTPAAPQLVNLSCLGTLAPGQFLTAGFVIGGSTPETVMIRATGPALANLGIANTMPDPALTLYANNGGQNSVLAVDQGWGAAQKSVSSIIYDSRAVGAFALSPNSQDSVVLMTLAPGAYSAQVQSYSGMGGATLIEVYEIP